MLAVKSLNLALRFLLELSALAALGYWGWQFGDAGFARVLLAAVTPLLAAGLWGRYIAPKAPNRLEDPIRAGVEVIFFGGAAAALGTSGAITIAAFFGIAAAVSLVLMFPFGQRGM